MHTRILVPIVCLLVAGAADANRSAQPPNDGPTRTAVDRINAAAAAWMRQHNAPALSLAIAKGDTEIFSAGYGLADVENGVQAQADTAYRLASVTKSLTAVAVMQLVERGDIELDAPVSSYCRGYPPRQTLASAPEAGFSITIRQLLVHHSGVRHNRPDEVLTTRHYGSIDEAVATVRDDPLVIRPGTAYAYSTPGYTLLGCAIEGASRMTYFEYLRRHVLTPAGMTRTFVDDTFAIVPNRSRGYRKTAAGQIQNAPLHDTSIKVPGGGLVTSARDMARFAVSLMAGRLVKPDTLAAMWSKPRTSDGKEQAYGMGFLMGERSGRQVVFNDGSQAGTRTYLFLVPKERLAIALMTNLERAWCEELVPTLMEALSTHQ